MTDRNSPYVFIVRQQNPENGVYDEDKVMLGFTDMESARKAYLAHYDNPNFLGDMDYMTIGEFKEALQERNGYIHIKQGMKKAWERPSLVLKAWREYSKVRVIKWVQGRRGNWFQRWYWVNPNKRKYKKTLVTMTGNELGKDKSIETLRERAFTYAKENLIGKKIVNKHTGFPIGINTAGIKKIIHHSARAEYCYSIYALPEILRNANKEETVIDMLNRPDVIAIHRFHSILRIGHENFLVNMVVREVLEQKQSGEQKVPVKKHYDHYLMVINKLD